VLDGEAEVALDITAEVVVKSGAGSVLAAEADGDDGATHPSQQQLGRVATRLRERGFAIGPIGPFSVTVTAEAELYRQATGARLQQSRSGERQVSFATRDPSLHRPAAADWADVDGFVLVPTETGSPSLRAGSSATVLPKPKVDYYHLDAPHDLVRLLKAERAHCAEIDGRGVDVVIVDTGWWNHPWFSDRHLCVEVVLAPGATDPTKDEIGHGTMVCASLLSLAAGARVTLIKQGGDSAFPAFKMAIGRKPAIIQNTWGVKLESRPIPAAQKLVAATVRHAVAQGIIVVFAGGNEKKIFPQQMPQAIAVGGAYVAPDGAVCAADYASGYMSQLYPGRIVPDFCGLVGNKPNGVYIMMPTMPASVIDAAFAEQPYPEGDGTNKPDDGWVVISGTSSASAQVSGVIAMLKQLRPQLDQATVRDLLRRTARPILHGQSAEGNPAGLPVPNLATGFGLVDAAQALAGIGHSV
jgi:subtilisin family serine protease